MIIYIYIYIFNLTSEPIIRKVKDFKWINQLGSKVHIIMYAVKSWPKVLKKWTKFST